MQEDQLSTGNYLTIRSPGETFRAFVPSPLPPQPEPVLSKADHVLLERANQALGRLDGLTRTLPDAGQFIYIYLRKEAVLSSMIEGTQSSLSQLLLFESDDLPGIPVDDVQEVSNYVSALQHGLSRLRNGFPLSSRLLREIHAVLLNNTRGADRQPGEFRRSQNWIGGRRPGNAVYVPPPPDYVVECMSALEKYIHESRKTTPLLISAALTHVQFESIHPFLDGNGRLGRLLITLMTCWAGVLQDPCLYLSLYLKTNRDEYYSLLQTVRKQGTWLEWIRFFLEGVIHVCENAAETAMRCMKLFETDIRQISDLEGGASSMLAVQRVLQRQPAASVLTLAKLTSLSRKTVATALSRMQHIGLVNEVTGKKRNRVYMYKQYLEILNEGIEP